MSKHRQVIREKNVNYVALIDGPRCNTNWELIFMGKPLPWLEFQKLYNAGRGESITNMIKSCEEYGFEFFDGEYLYHNNPRLLPVINVKIHPYAYFTHELIEFIETDDKLYNQKPVVNVTLEDETYRVVLKPQLGLNYGMVDLVVDEEDNDDSNDVNRLIPALNEAGFNAKQELDEICNKYYETWRNKIKKCSNN